MGAGVCTRLPALRLGHLDNPGHSSALTPQLTDGQALGNHCRNRGQRGQPGIQARLVAAGYMRTRRAALTFSGAQPVRWSERRLIGAPWVVALRGR